MKKLILPAVLAVGLLVGTTPVVQAACDSAHPIECRPQEEPEIIIVDAVIVVITVVGAVI